MLDESAEPVDLNGLSVIRGWYAFHAWARPRVLAAAERLDSAALRRPGVIAGGSGDGSLYETLAHIVGAEALWLARWQGETTARLPTGGDYPDLATLAREWERVEFRCGEFLSGLRLEDLSRSVRYLSVTRAVFEAFPLWQTLLHAANHTTHHRAEACAALTAFGAPPASVDLVDFLRAGTGTPE